MKEYESIFHQKICIFFQYLSFVSVVISLVFGLAFLWGEGLIGKEWLIKTFFSTGLILVTSFIIAAIFSSDRITILGRK